MADSSDPGYLAEDETRLTRLACPDCGGVLAEISLPSVSYFRCHVGHQFGLKALAAAQAEASETKLWSAVAALEEQVVVLRHIAEHDPAAASTGQRDGREQESCARKADEISELMRIIRAHLQRGQQTG
jgi:two-component system chemotaxis response regulator CheB